MGEALADPQIASRGVLHRHESAPGIDGAFTVPVAAFKFAHDGPRVDRPPPMFGQHTDEVLGELGYSGADIAAVPEDGRDSGVVISAKRESDLDPRSRGRMTSGGGNDATWSAWRLVFD